jgi:chorismate mutase
MLNKNILKIRKDLDKLDDKLLKILIERKNLVDLVIKNKKYKKDIIDQKRISVILKTIKKKSKKLNIDPLVTNKIWKSMIKAFIDYEYRNFKK